MAIYIIFLAFIFFSYLAIVKTRTSDTARNKRLFLDTVFVAMFLIYSLRASTVGRDLPGYEYAYGMTMSSYAGLYFEKGYILLMVACRFLRMPFQLFLTLVNFIILFPVYLFTRKYSRDVLMSVLVYVCYMLFEFNMTGIRQAIASSIVLLAYMVLLESKRFPLVKYVLIVALAFFFHKGALIALVYVPFHFFRTLRFYVSGALAAIVLALTTRGFLITYIKELFQKDSMHADAEVYIGLNFIAMCALAVAFICARLMQQQNETNQNPALALTANELRFDSRYSVNTFCLKLFLLSLAVMLLFGTDTATRSTMFLSQVLIVLLPNCVHETFEPRSRLLLQFFCYVFLVVFMIFETLLPNNFDIVPYRFFWQTP